MLSPILIYHSEKFKKRSIYKIIEKTNHSDKVESGEGPMQYAILSITTMRGTQFGRNRISTSVNGISQVCFVLMSKFQEGVLNKAKGQASFHLTFDSSFTCSSKKFTHLLNVSVYENERK